MRLILLTASCLGGLALSAPTFSSACQEVDVVILGAGSAGISAAISLAQQNVTNFALLEYNSDVGGRVRHESFGYDHSNGNKPYTVEQGANWLHGVEKNEDGSENPMVTLARKYGLKTTPWNISDYQTYTDSGKADFTGMLNTFAEKLEIALGTVIADDKDLSVRVALRRAGWNSDRRVPEELAAEVFGFDFQYNTEPELTSAAGREKAVKGDPGSFYPGPDEFVLDSRGFNYILKQELGTVMSANDPRLYLDTIVSNVSVQDDSSVVVHTRDGKCFHAKYAICTFSMGVLQNAALQPQNAPFGFDPPLPAWKQEAISSFGMGIYTKIFLQFSNSGIFWPQDGTENFVYASPQDRGYFPIWQSLSLPNFHPDSGILFATMTHEQSRRIEHQSDHETQAEAIAVLKNMFGEANVPDEPIAFMYPRWGSREWAYGSYSYWPVGFTSEQYEDLKRNVGGLHFAGEALGMGGMASVHGAWASGKAVASKLTEYLKEPSLSVQTPLRR